MKVLMVGHERIVHGASRSMVNLIDALSDRCEFSVVLPFPDGPVYDSLIKRKVKVYYVPFYRWVEPKDNKYIIKRIRWILNGERHNQQLAAKLAAEIKAEHFDIIHSNTSVVDFGYRLSKILNLPHIWHIREFGEADFNMYPLVSYKHYYYTMQNHNHLVCISKAVMNKFSGILPEEAMSLIYNGVEPWHRNPQKTYHSDGTMICLQSGLIISGKGQDVTVKAFDLLHNRGIKDIEILFAGGGSLKNLGIDISSRPWIHVLGTVDNLPEIRKNVDLEIVSSKAEAFGRVTVEAMMGGIPVIGSDSGGTIELIRPGENGLLFHAGDPESLADQIQHLFTHREEIARMGRLAYQSSADYFQIQRCAEEVWALYQKTGGCCIHEDRDIDIS